MTETHDSLHINATGSPRCSAVFPLRINLEDILKENVGAFKLSFLQDGAIRTIGNLDIPGLSSDPAEIVNTQDLTSTPLGDQSQKSASICTASTPVLKDIHSGSLLSKSPSTAQRGVYGSPTPCNLASFRGYSAAYCHQSCPTLPTPSPLASYDSTDEEDPDTTAVNLFEAFEKSSSEGNGSVCVMLSGSSRAQAIEGAGCDPALWCDSELVPSLQKSMTLVSSVLEQLNITNTEAIDQEITALRDLIWGLKPQMFKSLSAVLINSNYPARRRRFPYQRGRPFYGWPKGIRYRDPAHLCLGERLAITIWAYLNPSHRLSNVELAHSTIAKRMPTHQLDEIHYVVTHLRLQLWGEGQFTA